jgi:hypothetical protein
VGAPLLSEVEAFLRRHVILTTPQATAAVLWAAHTHALDAFETTPFLAITSPEKRCGKSRLLDTLELVVARPWRTIMPSEAVLFRKIEATQPALMLDECDAIFNTKNSNTEPLRALLNAGNRRGTFVPRCVGPRQELVDFGIFSAKALAGIGNLPDTVTDRSIVIRMARKRRDETTARFRIREAEQVAEPLHNALASWLEAALPVLEQARPEIPDGLDDRAEEAWEPLLAIADAAGGRWPERARLAAIQLSSADRRDDEALGVRLLADIRDVFAGTGTDRLASAVLATRLGEIEESPWGDLWGKPLDARGLARRLKPFEIHPRTVRLDDGTTAKGYLLEQFEDAFGRYLADLNVTTSQPASLSEKTAESVRHKTEPVTDENGPFLAPANACDVVTDKTAFPANGAQLSDVERARLFDATYPPKGKA